MLDEYIIEITISNEDYDEDNTVLEYEYKSEETASDIMDYLKEELSSREPISGDNTYDINIEVKGKNHKFRKFSDRAMSGLSMVSDSIYDIHTLIDSVIN